MNRLTPQRKKRSRRETIKALLPILRENYSFGVFDSLAAQLGIDDCPFREEQEELLARLAPRLVGIKDAKRFDQVVREEIATWLLIKRAWAKPQALAMTRKQAREWLASLEGVR